jgi:hypothetical protein
VPTAYYDCLGCARMFNYSIDQGALALGPCEVLGPSFQLAFANVQRQVAAWTGTKQKRLLRSPAVPCATSADSGPSTVRWHD